MTVSAGEADILEDLRGRSRAEGGVFWVNENEFAVFDPEAAQIINSLNWSDLLLPDRLVDLLRRRASPEVFWQEVRSAWIAQTRHLTETTQLTALAQRTHELLDAHCGCSPDFIPVIHDVIGRAFLPTVVSGLSSRDQGLVLADQTFKVCGLLATEPTTLSWRQRMADIWVQIRAGHVVRRELRGRARGTRPRQLDLTDPIVDLLPRLGMDRAVDAVTGVLTAIAGPPGAAATALLYALAKYPEERSRVEEELAALPFDEIVAAPTRRAPATHRFIKEVLRLWSPTPLANREVRKEIVCPYAKLHVGQQYLLSPDLQHHDPRFWHEPERFDPDRWLAAQQRPRASGAYVPFGWAPRACIGSSLATSHLILLAHALATRYRLEVEDPTALKMALFSVPTPRNFRGTLTRRS